MSYFRKVTDDEGKETFVEVDLANEELPEVVVKNQKPYKSILTETINRRHKIDELEAAIKDLKSPETVETDEPAKKEVSSEPANKGVAVDPDQLFAEFEARLRKKQEEERKQAEELKNSTAALIKEFGLSADDAEILAAAKDPRVTAEKLAKRPYRFDDQEGGNPAKKEVESAIGGAFAKLGLND